MKHLYLHARQIIGNDVARHEDGFRAEVVGLLHTVGPAHLVFEREIGNAFLVDIPQDLVATFPTGFLLQGHEDVDGIFVFAEKNDSHDCGDVFEERGVRSESSDFHLEYLLHDGGHIVVAIFSEAPAKDDVRLSFGQSLIPII